MYSFLSSTKNNRNYSLDLKFNGRRHPTNQIKFFKYSILRWDTCYKISIKLINSIVEINFMADRTTRDIGLNLNKHRIFIKMHIEIPGIFQIARVSIITCQAN